MLKRFFPCLLIFMSLSKPTIAQNNKFDDLKNRMFFNIFLFKPDSVVRDFLEKYYPMFCKPYSSGKWQINPAVPPIRTISTLHSFFFKTHPVLKSKFYEGRLDFFSDETLEYGRGVKDFDIWFFFDSKIDASNAFKELSSMFEKYSKSKKIVNENDKIIASYSNKDTLLRSNSVQIILTKDELFENKYKIFFRIGSYTYPPKSNDLRDKDKL